MNECSIFDSSFIFWSPCFLFPDSKRGPITLAQLPGSCKEDQAGPCSTFSEKHRLYSSPSMHTAVKGDTNSIHFWRGGYMPASNVLHMSSRLFLKIKQSYEGVLLSHARGGITESRLVRLMAWGHVRGWQPAQDAACTPCDLPTPCPLLLPPPLPLVNTIHLPGLRHSVIHRNVVRLPCKSPFFEWASCQPGWQSDT